MQLLKNPPHLFQETDSTNDEAIRRAKKGAPEGEVFVARRQTAGRGRMGRSWESPAGNLYISYLLRPLVTAEQATRLTLAAAEAICKTLAPLALAPLTIKPPNDVYLGEKKIAGILTESSTMKNKLEWVVIGIGINVHATDFSPEVAKTATSLKAATGRTFDLEKLASSLTEHLDQAYRAFLHALSH